MVPQSHESQCDSVRAHHNCKFSEETYIHTIIQLENGNINE
jgi:hypothetical protein